MNTVATLSEVAKDTHEINFIEGSFSATEAQDLVIPMIAKKINFHQVKRMSLFEKNNGDACVTERDRLVELEEAKIKAEEILLLA